MNISRADSIVVVGGGIAGLSAAYRLTSNACDVVLFEQEKRIGGKCSTENIKGFTFDTGTQHFRDSYDNTLKTSIALQIGAQLRFPPVKVGIVANDRVFCFRPRSLGALRTFAGIANTRAGALFFPASMRRFLRDYRSFDIRFPGRWSPGDTDPASHFTGGVYGNGDVGFISPAVIFSLGSDIVSVSRAGLMVALRLLFADRIGCFAGGMSSLVEAISRDIKCETGSRVEEIVVEGGKVSAVRKRDSRSGRVKIIETSRVVCAVPAYEALDILPGIGGRCRKLMNGCDYSPQVVVNLGFGEVVESEWDVILLHESRGLNSSWICFTGGKTFEHTPLGKTTVTAIFSGRRAQEVVERSDEETIGLVLSDIREIARKDLTPEVHLVTRYPRGRPVVSRGHAQKIGELWSAGSGIEGLYLAGDWTLSPTLEGALTSGILAAEKLLSENV